MKPWKWIAGIDYSMTCPAITLTKADIPFMFETCQLFYLSEKVPVDKLPNVCGRRLVGDDYTSNEERFDIISEWAVNTVLDTVGGDSVAAFIEDYSFASKGKVFHIAENTGLMKHKLFKHRIPISTIPPTVIKKFAREKGVATKDQMYTAFLSETGVKLFEIFQPKAAEVGSPTGDLVDSYFICKYGYHKG
jgi:hypothetical protein